jgi:mRNA interferase RelE/StbE
MLYSVQFTPRAQRDFSALDRAIQQRLRRRIDRLAEDPFPVGVKKLHAEEPFYRIRVSDYRVIYQVQVNELLVVVVKIGHRREVYR